MTSKKNTYCNKLLTLLLLILGTVGAWAQTDYSGTYYIASDAIVSKKHIYNANTPANNYYLCPTEGWCYYKATDDFWPHDTEDGNKTMPFLTTYKCKTNDYHSGNASDAIWNIEKAPAPNDAYYYIRQASTGKYLTANGKVENAGIDRIRVHLESFDNPNGAGNKILFDISPNSKGDLVISPQAIQETGTHDTYDHSTHRWLVVNGGNKNFLTGQSNKTGGPTGYTYTSGIIGIYTQTDDNAPFVLEKALSIDPPIITNNGDGTFTITAATGATIYYTTNGDRPTTSTTTTGTTSVVVNQTAEMTVIKALAKATSDPFPTVVTTYNIPVCEKPVITISGGNVTITCATDGAAIHYTTDDTPADASSTTYVGPFDKGDASTIRAVATKAGYVISSEAILLPPTVVSSSSQITDMAGSYILASDFTLTASIGSASEPFSGIIDGNMITLSGFSHPLVAYANGATIKNVMLKNVQIDGSGSVGAIVGVAEGYTRIYNCGILPSDNKYENESSFVLSDDGYCGGLVGWLKDDSRVINCFSYANIKGGTDVAGIVGHNEAGSTTAVTTVGGKDYYSNLRTAVVNCMFYGNITSGTNRWPVYGGAKMTNKGATAINNYDFYRAEASLGLIDDNHYNCSFPAKEEYLTKYEYYRYLLNSNRELCGWWVGAPSAPSTMTTAEVQAVPKDANLMAKWVLDQSIAPYPILKPAGKYPSVINQSPEPATTAVSAASAMRIDSSTKKWVDRASSTNTEMVNPKAAPETDGQILGTIKVNISDGSNSQTRYCAITAMDIDNNDFNYGKIQLPYYNSIFGNPNGTTWEAKYGGNYTDYVVVGWTISSPSGTNIPSISNQTGTDENGIAYDHTYSEDPESGYNFADRYCTTKDANRIFAQGGYYYVPYGVSEITITAKWASAIYLDNGADHSYDRVYMSYDTDPNKNIGIHFAPAGSRPTTLGNGKTVLTASISSKIPSGGKVYDNAIVLVGNHQYRVGNNNLNTLSGCTIISADFDLDDEPDNCLIWQLGQGTNRYNICPIRFDFLPVVEMGLAMKEDGSTQYFSLGCYRPRGHFEVTETSLIHFGQFEFGNSTRDIVDPLILNGGIYDQYCKGTMSAAPDATNGDYINYIILGGNVRMPSFTPGAHVRTTSNFATFHCPVSVMGGNIDYLYLTGNFNDKVTPNADNPHCYIDGGNYKQVAAAAKEGIDGNVTFKVNHSIIQEFYGGSTLADKQVTGNIDVTMDNSNVTKYCGGPKFGNMNLNESDPTKNKTVTTNANGTTFGVYYGGGNGGTSYMQYASTDKTVDDATAAYDWDNKDLGNLQSYTPRAYYKKNSSDAKGIGYKADYEMEIVNSSAGTDAKKAIFRTYFYAAQFSATNTGPISNYLTGCKVLTNFYGGGNLGGVKGNVSSTLTDTEVQGSAFGAGYSASVPDVTVYDKDKTAPTVNVYTGIITPAPDPDPSSHSTTYTWCYKNSTTNVVIPSGVVIPNTVNTSKPAFEYGGKNYLYTEESLENLGTVTGVVTLNINGSTTVGGNVYGGGEESGVGGNTTVSVTGGTIGTGTTGFGNVFGAGKGLETDYSAALVKGNSNVTMSGGTVKGNIYGGGELSSVGTFTFSTTDTSEPAKIDSWTDNTGKTTINISGGKVGNEDEYTYDANNTISHTNGGNVFAGSKGSLFQVGTTTATSALWSKFAKVKNTEITISANAAIMSNVYGGGEIGSVGYDTNTGAVGGTVITINGGTIGTEIKDGETAKYTFGSVFGGGYGSSIEELIYSPQTGDPIKTNPKLHAGIVYGSTKVTMSGDNTRVWASVYGGGEVASVKGNPSTAEADVFTTDITINGGFIGRDKEDKDKFVSKAQFGGATMGNVYGGGSGYKEVVRAGQIKGNTKITINGGTIYHNVYGGGAYATVGDFNYGYTTAETGPFAGIPKVSSVNGLATEKTGFAKITITGGTIGVDGMENGMVFGSSRGDVGEQRDLWLAWVDNTKVEIGSTTAESDDYPLIKGSVYGSGENGHVYSNTDVIIHSGTIGFYRENDDYNNTRGNVYGGGCGEDTYPSNTQVEGMAGKYEPSAGIVYGTAKVTVDGGIVKHNIYGAGALGSVGQTDANGAITSGGTTTIAISGGTIGHDGNDNGNVYGAARGNANSTQTGIAQVQTTGVTISGTADVKGSVFGGGEAGTVRGAVTVNMNGGDVLNDVYGGGALADTNTANWDATNNTWADTNDKSSVYTTAVNLTGGTVTGNVYGGGLGKMAVGTEGQTGYEPAIEAKVYGNTTVELNNGVADDAKGCMVKGSIFGCNNMSGSPQGTTTVHIYKTQREGADRITNAAAEGEEGQPGYIPAVENAKEKGIKFGGEYDPASFDVKAVYGGGNMAAYQPVDLTTGTTDVIIDGCDRTSICQVYGGGNAACTPATKVTINGTYEIGELFGGGNGKDDIFVDNVYKPNPGANVGYKDYSEFYFEGAVWKVRDKADADTKEKRIGKYQYGNGVASVNVFGGLVHRVFGGSNTKGNVRQTALTLLDENSGCTFCVDEAYGGGKSAPMDAEAKLLMACIPGLQAVYGGAEAASIQGNVTLNITNGTFDRVFGGNNLSGTINGSITVNVEEVGCKPVKIGELYGGGNEAGYSIYGYKEVTENGKKVWKPRESDHDSGTGPANPYNDPQVNVKSFTSIGNIYGGGYGGGATMVGNPTVNVNEIYGKYYDKDESVVGENAKTPNNYSIPSHAKGKMGAINNVFGGGNAAKVIGNTNVNIATLEEVYVVKEIAEGASVAGLYTRSGAGTTASPFEYKDAAGTAQADTTYYEKQDVLGVDIRGNVYGGGNNAEVTGDSKVKIGKREGE